MINSKPIASERTRERVWVACKTRRRRTRWTKQMKLMKKHQVDLCVCVGCSKRLSLCVCVCELKPRAIETSSSVENLPSKCFPPRCYFFPPKRNSFAVSEAAAAAEAKEQIRVFAVCVCCSLLLHSRCCSNHTQLLLLRRARSSSSSSGSNAGC